MPILIRKAQGGFKTQRDTTGYYDKATALMEKYKHLNWVSRANDPSTGPPSVDNRSHYLGYSNIGNQQQAYPLTVQKEGEDFLTNLDTHAQGIKEAKNTKSLVPLGTDKNFADYFTIMGYKQKWGDAYEDAKFDYSKLYNKK